MTPLQEKLRNLVLRARQIHAQERNTVIDSLRVIGELATWRAELYRGGKHERVAQEVGLTADQYSKGLRVARLANTFPRAIQYLREGRTCLSHLALVGDKITEANEQVIWDHVLDKGRREVEDFLRRVPAAAGDDQDLLSRGSSQTCQGERPKDEATRTGRKKIPESVKREVFHRAQGCCQHVMADGKRCRATRMLEIDPIVPVARGGGDEISNLTLVCRDHNYDRAWVIMGPDTMDQHRMNAIRRSKKVPS